MGQLISVASGKGGVGKSFISSGLALSLQGMGKRVLLVDLDLGGANLHTLLKLEEGDGIYRLIKQDTSIQEIIQSTPYGIDFISGNDDIVGMANITRSEKNKIVNALKKLDYDYIVIDLGGGSSFSLIDFFNASDKQVLVINSEPTSIENCFGLLKVAIYRYIERTLSMDTRFDEICSKIRSKSFSYPSVQDILDDIEKLDSDVYAAVTTYLETRYVNVVINMVRTKSDIHIYSGLSATIQKYLDMRSRFVGFIPFDMLVSKSIKQRELTYNNPELSVVTECINAITTNIIT